MQFTFAEPDTPTKLTSDSKASDSSIVVGVKDLSRPGFGKSPPLPYGLPMLMYHCTNSSLLRSPSGTYTVRSWDKRPGGAILLSLVGASTPSSGLAWSTVNAAPAARVEVPSTVAKAFGHKRPGGSHASWTIDIPHPGCVSTMPHCLANHRNQARTCTVQ